METAGSTISALLSELGVSMPFELLSRLDIEEYLDRLDRTAALVAGERERLGDVLRAAEYQTPRRRTERFSAGRCDALRSGAGSTGEARYLPREQALVLQFKRERTGAAGGNGKYALGNIMVASDQITRVQLEAALLRQSATGRRLGEELVTTGDADRHQVEHGLRLQKALLAGALAIVVGLVATAPLPTAAAQASASLQVSARVIAGARMQIDNQPTQLTITAADVAKAYVEVPATTRLSVTSNSRSGYRIDFHSQGDFFESVDVAGFGNIVRLGADGGTIVQRGPLPPSLSHELGFRFTLRPGTLPGLYPWPLQLSVQPL